MSKNLKETMAKTEGAKMFSVFAHEFWHFRKCYKIIEKHSEKKKPLEEVGVLDLFTWSLSHHFSLVFVAQRSGYKLLSSSRRGPKAPKPTITRCNPFLLRKTRQDRQDKTNKNMLYKCQMTTVPTGQDDLH